MSARLRRLSGWRGLATCALMLLGIGRSRSAAAQVNVERLRADLAEKPVFATIEGSVTGRTGNTEGIVAGGAALVGVSSGRHLAFAKAQGDYARFAGETTVSRSFAHVRYDYELSSLLSAESFAQVQQDRFQRLRLRTVFGVGPRFTVLGTEDIDVHLGVAYMLEYETLEPGTLDVEPFPSHRLSTYATAAIRVTDAGRLTTTTYVQPRFDMPSDYRILSDSALEVGLGKRLSTKLAIVVRHDSQPPEGVLATDVEVRNSLAVTF